MQDHPFVFLGHSEEDGSEAGVLLEKNLLTFAGSRSGKGACHIIPTLQRWPFNAVVIDPSGEAAEETAEAREREFGGTVAVLDPFGQANVPARLRAAFNPLDAVKKSADLKAIADGLILRSANESQPHFNNSAKDAAAGLLAFIKQDETLEGHERSIARLPDLIAALQDESLKAATIDAMKQCEGFGGLARQVGQRLSPDNTEVANILGTLRTQTEWIDEDMEVPLSRTGFLEDGETSLLSDLRDGRQHPTRSFDLKQLKEGRMTLYLVLPADKLGDYGRYLRLFVKLLMSVMLQKTQGGKNMGERCLFILDEAYACGRLNEVVSMSGQMAKYGLHLWLFWQSIGQITELYGKDGLETLSEDADATTIFGVRGLEICEHASKIMGVVKPEDVQGALALVGGQMQADQASQMRGESYRQGIATAAGLAGQAISARREHNRTQVDRMTGRPPRPPRSGQPGQGTAALMSMMMPSQGYVPNQDLISIQNHLRAKIGKPYMHADEIKDAVKKHEGEPIPRRMLVNTGSGYRFLAPRAYFQEEVPDHIAKLQNKPTTEEDHVPVRWVIYPGVGAVVATFFVNGLSNNDLLANSYAGIGFWVIIFVAVWWFMMSVWEN